MKEAREMTKREIHNQVRRWVYLGTFAFSSACFFCPLYILVMPVFLKKACGVGQKNKKTSRYSNYMYRPLKTSMLLGALAGVLASGVYSHTKHQKFFARDILWGPVMCIVNDEWKINPGK